MMQEEEDAKKKQPTDLKSKPDLVGDGNKNCDASVQGCSDR